MAKETSWIDTVLVFGGAAVVFWFLFKRNAPKARTLAEEPEPTGERLAFEERRAREDVPMQGAEEPQSDPGTVPVAVESLANPFLDGDGDGGYDDLYDDEEEVDES